MKPSFIAVAVAAALSCTPALAADADFVIPAAAGQVRAGDGYSVKSFVFAPGTVKVITFDATAPKPYGLTDEAQFYVLSGAVSTDVGGASVDLIAGDVATRPTGAIRPKAPGAVVVAHKVKSASAEPKPQVVRGADTPAGLIVQWMADGKPMSATTEDAAKAAPSGAGRFTVARYVFDGNSIRVINQTKGGRTNPTEYKTNNIMFAVKGRLMRVVGDRRVEVKAGDAIVEQAGTTGYWEMLEDSQLISTTAID
jgi:mannose-6-phosphate isomerase-like protein (cupin superfamily)